jgi:hypothetical protein
MEFCDEWAKRFVAHPNPIHLPLADLAHPASKYEAWSSFNSSSGVPPSKRLPALLPGNGSFDLLCESSGNALKTKLYRVRTFRYLIFRVFSSD